MGFGKRAVCHLMRKTILGVFALGIGKEFELLFVNPREEREDVLNAVKNYRIAA